MDKITKNKSTLEKNEFKNKPDKLAAKPKKVKKKENKKMIHENLIHKFSIKAINKFFDMKNKNEPF